MNKPLPPITESPEHLQTQLRREPEAKRRQRLQALYLIASGQVHSRLALAQLLAVHRHTIHAWLALYAQGGLPALLTVKKAPGKRSLVTPTVVSKLQERLCQPCGFGSYGEIRRYLVEAHHVSIAYSTVHALVRYKLQAKPKAPRRSHPKKSLRRSRSFLKRLLPSS
jgi:transposase